MTAGDWFDDDLHTFGMFVSGSPLRAPGPRGEELRDASFLLWFHAHPEPGKAVLPANDWVAAGEVVLSTDPAHPVGERIEAGDMLDLGPRTMVVLRAF
jgi:glycogen operon protein